MNKLYLILFSILVISISMTSAQPTMTITNNHTELKFDFSAGAYPTLNDTAIDLDIITLKGSDIAIILDGFNFKINDSKIDYLYIDELDEYVFDIILGQYYHASFDIADVRNDNSILLSLLNNEQKELLKGVYLEKTGNHYVLSMNKGYDEYPEYKNLTSKNIKDYADIYSDLITPLIPSFLSAYYSELLNCLNFPIEVTIIYPDVYTPTEENIAEWINQIEGTNYSNITISVVESPLNNTETITQLKVMNISLDKVSDGTIYFNVNKSSVTDKDKISLYVYENSSWTKLTTTYITDHGLEYEYKAYTPHFSVFMIGEEKTITTTSSSSSNDLVHHHSSSGVIVKKNETIPKVNDTIIHDETPIVIKEEKKGINPLIVIIPVLVIGIIGVGFLIFRRKE